MGKRSIRLGVDELGFIARIYDVILEPRAWRLVLDELAGHTRALACNLLVSDSALPEVQVTEASAALDQGVLARYGAEYAQYEVEGLRNLLRRPAQRWVRVEQLVSTPIDELPSSRWLRQECGIAHRASARLNDSRGWLDVVTLNRGAEQGQITEAEIEVANLFLPHLAKAVEISRPFQLLRARFRAVLEALDRFHVGVLILDQLGRAMLRNREADRVLELRDGLSLDAAGRPRASDEAAQADLSLAVKGALATSSAEGETASTLLAVPRRSGQDAYLVEVSPLRGRDLGSEPSIGGAVAFVIDPVQHAQASTRGMKEVFGLTEAEAEVLRLLVGGHGSRAMAEVRGVSVETVRTQIKRILSKTGTGGRPALIRLALSVNPPVDPAV
jgi:DNA-binding CsgD family transcriptional regulator